MMSTSAAEDESGESGKRAAQRRRALFVAALVAILMAGAWAAYWALYARHHVTTDNAYVQGNLVQITPQVSGTVLAIHADDTDRVEAGQTLVRLDSADGRVALEQAAAALAQTVREVRTLFVNNASLSANIVLREAEAGKAQHDLQRTEDDLHRRQQAIDGGAVSMEELRHAQAAVAAAQSALAATQAAVTAAREQLAANRAQTVGTDIAHHPRVLRAAAQMHEAYLAYKRVELLAPVSGHVAKRNVQLGQRVQAGAPLMTIIPLDKLWVDANFKEAQLRGMRIGQPARLVADIYGGKVEYEGRIAGLGAGTGAAFALLPAQNATGNWIKVVQRVPVRIVLDPKQIAEHPLRVGLSMEVDVDIGDQSGKPLAEAPRVGTVAETTVFDTVARDSDAEVARVIAENIGATPAADAPAAPMPAKRLRHAAHPPTRHR